VRIVVAGALAVAVGTIAIDHLVGTHRTDEDSGLVDPATFAIALGLSLAAAATLFGWLVPRERERGPDRAARSGLACSMASIVPGLALFWLGVPFVVAGAGMALGFEGRAGTRRIEANAAIAIGALVLLLGAIGYLAAALI
jgi:hypothetical protein